MSYGIIQPQFFTQELKHILNKFPKSENSILKHIVELSVNPNQGSVVLGSPDFQVRKIRIGLKEYRISSSKGLRLMFLVKQKNIVLLHVYHKADYKREHKELNRVKAALKLVLKELT